MAYDEDLIFNIKMDQKDFETGIKKLGSVAGKALKTVETATVSAGTALLRMGIAATKVGMDFEAGAGELAETLNDNLKGKIESLKSALEELGISVYKGFDNPLKDVVETLTGYVERLTNVLNFNENLQDSMEELGVRAEYFGDGLESIPKGFEGAVQVLGEIFADMISKVAEYAPTLLQAAGNMLMSFIQGIRENLPNIVESALSIVQTLITTVLELLPEIITLGAELLISLITGIAEILPDLITQIIDAVIMVADIIIDNLPLLIDAGIQLMMALVEGIIENLPKLIEEVPRIINEFYNAISEQLPQILKMGIKILLELIKGLIDSIPTLIENIPAIIMAIENAFTLYDWWNLGKGVITKLKDGLVSMVENLGSSAKGLADNAIQAIKDVFWDAPKIGKGLVEHLITGVQILVESLVTTAKGMGIKVISSIKDVFGGAKDIGNNLVQGIWNGINNAKDWVLGKIEGFGNSIMKSIKSIFGIKSPSTVMRDEVGKNLTLGIGVGIEKGMPELERDVDNELSKLTRKMKAMVDFESSSIGNKIIAGSEKNGVERIVENHDDSDNSTTITGNTFVIRQESDIEKVAQELDRLRKRKGRGMGVATI
ncbi:hypothetical protein NSA47_02290 [Irregularibacter muris]|uniref:Phage tail protein n=1 Tax=Irregularibacter muris TaxID=1796619 RepID=A0AAE3HE78_9FIRM|nr:hypothetical protein [Irregularibacter muris]MCR1897817.1 hypothetical protein [Irregularibacter muris]